MMYRIVSYLKFIIRSSNQHGVHSPFVYNLVTNCFYDRSRKEADIVIRTLCKQNDTPLSLKTAKLLNRIIPYLAIKNIYIPEKTHTVIEQILSTGNLTNIKDTLNQGNQFDLFFLDWNIVESNQTLLDSIKDNVHNDSLLLIKGIHTSKKNTENWGYLTQQHAANVCIDTYQLGFVFFRKEQAKEHFSIRV